MKYITTSETETAEYAEKLAHELKPGDIVFLEGKLGAGKSVFARALIRALSGDATLDVPSPTFTLLQTYDADAGSIWHFDLYRIKSPDDIYELDWEDALYDGITIVEWPQRLESLAPNPRYRVRIETITDQETHREITIESA